ncbi:hypothetical protein [Acanthamoeba polyphaga mimivirus]|uniref:Uncharacterized protein n=1 Tax=Acanthamoeba polyphaga mimivirus TaxID=212035 RepID=A0A2L2DL27_MIMIV|nr:hypothetical protein [Acanthamoeba polyphaga mimivirus]
MSKTLNNTKSSKVKTLLLAKIETLKENGRKEITSKSQLDEYPIGSLISYLNKNNIFKSGGFLIKITNEYFIYITPDFTTKYRVRFRNVNKMWVGDPRKINNDILSLKKTTSQKTNFPAKIDDIVVHYAKDNFSLKRFKNTQKYQRMLQWYQYFCDK